MQYERHIRRGVALLALSLLAALGCGPMVGPARPAPPPTEPAPAVTEPAPEIRTGAIVVRNGTVDELEVELDGRLLTTLAPGEVFRSDRVRVGRHSVRVGSGDSAFYRARRIRVEEDREVRWHVRQGFGTFVVRNLLRTEVSVAVSGHFVGKVPAGSERRFGSIPEGRRAASVRGAGGEVLREGRVVFGEGSTVRWEIIPARPTAPPPASLSVLNDTPQRVEIMRDGYPIGVVPPGNTVRIDDIEPGAADFTARNRRGDILSEARIRLRSGETGRWRVALATCRLRVVNKAEGRYLISIDDRHMGPVAAGRAHVYAGLTPGSHELEARPSAGGVLRRRELVCPPGGSVEWVLNPPPRAALEVRNTTDAGIDVLMDGKVLGRVRAGFTVRFRNLRPGEHALTARSKGAPPHKRMIELSPGEVAGWVIGPRPASLTVTNGWTVPAIVVMDGRRLGRIAPKSRTVFKGLVAGRHKLRAERAGGTAQSAALVLSEGRTTAWEILPDAPARLRVINRNSVTVKIVVGGKSYGALKPGRERVIRGLAAGTVQAEARAPSGARDADTVRLVPGEETIWMARLPNHAALRVVNNADIKVTVVLGEKRLGDVGPHAVREFTGLRPGRFDAKALAGREVVASRRLSLTTGALASWVVSKRPRARLKVRNQGPERLIVSVDGRRLGPVPAAGVVVFRDLRPGKVTGVVTTIDGREVTRREFELKSGTTVTWPVRFTPAVGDVVVINRFSRPIRVKQGRKVIGTVAAGGRAVFELPRGWVELSAWHKARSPHLLGKAEVRIGARPVRWIVNPP